MFFIPTYDWEVSDQVINSFDLSTIECSECITRDSWIDHEDENLISRNPTSEILLSEWTRFQEFECKEEQEGETCK